MSSPVRKQRRFEQQAVFEAIYEIAGVEAAQEWVDNGYPTKQREKRRQREIVRETYGLTHRYNYVLAHRYRSYRCARCGGCGSDPEQPPQSYPPQEPPDPCGWCDGHGTIEPKHFRLARWPAAPWPEDEAALA